MEVTKLETFRIQSNLNSLDLTIEETYALRDRLNEMLVRTTGSRESTVLSGPNFDLYDRTEVQATAACASSLQWMILALQGQRFEAVELLRTRKDFPVDGLKNAKDVVWNFLATINNHETSLIAAVLEDNGNPNAF